MDRTDSKDAVILTKYLIGETPAQEIIQRYSNAIHILSPQLSDKDQNLWNLMMSLPMLIGSIDGALAIKNPDGEVRKRIFIMLAILEASPLYCSHFLSRKRGVLYLISIMISGIRAVFAAIIGLLILKAR